MIDDATNERSLAQRIAEIQIGIRGLSVEIEAWRKHTSTTSDFLQFAIKDLAAAASELARKLE